MFKRVTMIGVFSMSLVAMSVTSANAGRGFVGILVGTGSFRVTVDISGVPNPSTKPSVTVLTAEMVKIETLCLNPQNNNVLPGDAGERSITAFNVVDGNEITGPGQARVTIEIDLAFAEGVDGCVNTNWNPIPGSAAVSEAFLRLDWVACTGNAKTDPEPCFDGTTPTIESTPYDSVSLHCTLNPILRDEFNVVVPDQVYSCQELV